MKRELFC